MRMSQLHLFHFPLFQFTEELVLLFPSMKSSVVYPGCLYCLRHWLVTALLVRMRSPPSFPTCQLLPEHKAAERRAGKRRATRINQGQVP